MNLRLQTLPDLRSSYVLQEPEQVNFCTSQNRVYTYGQMHMCIPVSPAEKPNPNTMETHSPEYDNPTTYVIAQLYSSVPPLPRCAFIPTRENSGCFPFF